MNLNLLNEIKNRLVAFANDNGINLQAEFGSVEKFKQFVVLFTIRSLVEIGGMELSKAWDLVNGSGSYQDMADAVWAQCQPNG